MRFLDSGTWTIGRWADIPVRIHWSFGLLLLYVLFVAYSENSQTSEILWLVLLLVSLFAFVVQHEYGHALMARKYGSHTRDILILPIGGLARLESLPSKPIQEFWIAIAGPLVNLVWAIVLAAILLTAYGLDLELPVEGQGFEFNLQIYLLSILVMNAALFLFNLIPAFPMDGGRILRALLSIRLGQHKATIYATLISQILALAFVLIGLYFGHYVLMAIGLVIFLMARQNFRSARMAEKLEQTYAREFLIPLHYSDINSLQQLVGVTCIARDGGLFQIPVLKLSEWDEPSEDHLVMDADARLKHVLPYLRPGKQSKWFMIESGKIVGHLDLQKLSRFIGSPTLL